MIYQTTANSQSLKIRSMENRKGGKNVATTNGETVNNPLRELLLPWNAAGITLLVCWVTSFLGCLSFVIIPFIIIGIIVAIWRKAILPCLFVILLNPLSIFFFGGVVSYIGGSPAYGFRGLPRIESLNPDRQTRCFRRGGGCVVHGNEWVYLRPHNLALDVMVSLFGPPRNAYDGPYPSKEDALHHIENAAFISLEDFREGRIAVDEQIIELGEELLGKLVTGLEFYSLLSYLEYANENVENVTVQARTFEDRCIILRITETYDISNNSDDVMNDFLILLDKNNKRPFAYYSLAKPLVRPRPPVFYLE